MKQKIAIILKSASLLKEKLSFIEALNEDGFTEVSIVEDEYDNSSIGKVFDGILEKSVELLGVIVIDCHYCYSLEDISKVYKEFISNPYRLVYGCNYNNKKGLADKMISLMKVQIEDIRTGIYAIPIKNLKKIARIKGNDIVYNIHMFNIIRGENLDYTSVFLDLEPYKRISFLKTIMTFVLVFKSIITFLISSLASTLVDISLFNVILFLTKGTMSKKMSILVSSIVARVFSSLFNYTLNRKTVFSSTESVKESVVRYYILAVVQMLVSAGLVTTITTVLSVNNQGIVTGIKMVVDTLLFFISYQIQKKWVFKTN